MWLDTAGRCSGWVHKGVVQALLPVSKDDGGVYDHGYELRVLCFALSECDWEWENTRDTEASMYNDCISFITMY
jgi:hypothetical protein